MAGVGSRHTVGHVVAFAPVLMDLVQAVGVLEGVAYAAEEQVDAGDDDVPLEEILRDLHGSAAVSPVIYALELALLVVEEPGGARDVAGPDIARVEGRDVDVGHEEGEGPSALFLGRAELLLGLGLVRFLVERVLEPASGRESEEGKGCNKAEELAKLHVACGLGWADA